MSALELLVPREIVRIPLVREPDEVKAMIVRLTNGAGLMDGPQLDGFVVRGSMTLWSSSRSASLLVFQGAITPEGDAIEGRFQIAPVLWIFAVAALALGVLAVVQQSLAYSRGLIPSPWTQPLRWGCGLIGLAVLGPRLVPLMALQERDFILDSLERAAGINAA